MSDETTTCHISATITLPRSNNASLVLTALGYLERVFLSSPDREPVMRFPARMEKQLAAEVSGVLSLDAARAVEPWLGAEIGQY